MCGAPIARWVAQVTRILAMEQVVSVSLIWQLRHSSLRCRTGPTLWQRSLFARIAWTGTQRRTSRAIGVSAFGGFCPQQFVEASARPTEKLIWEIWSMQRTQTLSSLPSEAFSSICSLQIFACGVRVRPPFRRIVEFFTCVDLGQSLQSKPLLYLSGGERTHCR